MMQCEETRKKLQYLCIDPNFDIQKIKTGALRYVAYNKPQMLWGGLNAYGRLEMYEMLPQEHIRSFIYVGWYDMDDDDMILYDRAMRWGGLTLI